jgi:hypothetical protein
MPGRWCVIQREEEHWPQLTSIASYTFFLLLLLLLLATNRFRTIEHAALLPFARSRSARQRQRAEYPACGPAAWWVMGDGADNCVVLDRGWWAWARGAVIGAVLGSPGAQHIWIWII